jgi:hypothetical protein
MDRRVPREPEEQRPGFAFEPLRQRLDPPAPNGISLSSRQLDLLQQRRQQRDVFVTKSNQLDSTKNVGSGSNEPRKPKGSSISNMSHRSINSNGGSSQQLDASTKVPAKQASSPTYWRHILEKATSQSSATSFEGKKSIKNVLAQRMLRNKLQQQQEKQQHPAALTTADSQKTSTTLRERLAAAAPASRRSHHQAVRQKMEEQRDQGVTAQVVPSLSLEQILPPPKATETPPVVSTPTVSNESEPEGYGDFFQILQAEVSGQHSQVRFSILLSNSAL